MATPEDATGPDVGIGPRTSPPDGPGITLVTGATGHLGANLVRDLLESGQSVRVLLHPEHEDEGVAGLDVERVEGDVRSVNDVTTAVRGCQRVYHCAAHVSTTQGTPQVRRAIFETNVTGSRHVLEAAERCSVDRIVVTGSLGAVGFDLDDPSAPSNESMPFYPFRHVLPYEVSKVHAELECMRAVARGLDVVIATSCAILGGHDYLPSRMGGTICDVAAGRIRAYVAGGFEFVAARDIVAGHRLAMQRGRTGEKYIFGSGFATLEEVLDEVVSLSGSERPKLRLPAPLLLGAARAIEPMKNRLAPEAPQRLTAGAIRLLGQRRRADTTKARKELGFRPTPIRDAITEAYAFHRSRGAIAR